MKRAIMCLLGLGLAISFLFQPAYNKGMTIPKDKRALVAALGGASVALGYMGYKLKQRYQRWSFGRQWAAIKAEAKTIYNEANKLQTASASISAGVKLIDRFNTFKERVIRFSALYPEAIKTLTVEQRRLIQKITQQRGADIQMLVNQKIAQIIHLLSDGT